MKVIDNRKKEDTKTFVEIKLGECFKRPLLDEIYMRIEDVKELYDDGWNYDWYTAVNAVSLKTGFTRKFYSSDKVIPLTCECVITNN